MRIISMLTLALLIGNSPIRAQATNISGNEAQSPAVDGVKPADISVDLLVGTLGIGLQVSKLVTPRVGVRGAVSYFSLSRTINQTNIDYDAELKLGAISGLLDFYPSSRGVFHLTGGLVSNLAKVNGTGVCNSGTIDINSHTYSCAQVGTLTAAVDFPSVAPYLGLGVGTPARGSRVHVVFDLGVAVGTPDLTLTASNPSNNAQLAADVQAQRDKTQKDINKYAKVYPVIQLGLGVRF